MVPGMSNVLTNPPDAIHTDIVVIGSGPGGAITACLLAEAGREVLLVEDGPFLTLDSCPAFSRTEMVQKYRNGGITVTMGKAKVAYVEGQCVGGGSEINSGLYHRTPPEILEEWRREFQVDGMTESDLLPYFEANEHDLSVSTDQSAVTAASLKLHEGATKLGWKSLEVPRWFRGGVKQSMTQTFIPRYLKAGGRMLPHARVRKLVRSSNGWRLRTEHRAAEGSMRPIDIEAGTVFVAAGAIQTPAILRRSGITRNIGNSLRLHPTVKIVAEFNEAINAHEPSVGVHQVKEFAPRISFGCSVSSRPHLALALVHYPDILNDLDEDWPKMAVYYAMTRGGRGTIRTVPGFRDPLVRYQLTPADWTDLTEAMYSLGRCLFAARAMSMCPSISRIRGGFLVTCAEDLLIAVGDRLGPATTDLMTIHLFSSCPMGEDKEKCATDSFGRVHGVDNLYIADASLLCTAPGVNPQGSIMAIARRNAVKFLE